METTQRGLSKRDFLKACLCGGCALGLDRLFSVTGAAPGGGSLLQGGEEPGKWSKEAVYWERAGGAVRCLKCPNACMLPEGATGRCRNRVNVRGTMYSIAYGNPCAVHIDPVEKKPLCHFLPSTQTFSIAAAGCNLRCLNCQNWQISQVSPHETENVDLMPERVVEQCSKSGCASIAYTYSEPTTFYEYAYDTAVLAHGRKIRNIWKSNGYINEAPLRKLCRVLDAANIDLKTFDEKVYAELNGGALAPVLRSLKVFKEEGVWLEITNLVIPTWTDHQETIKRMADWLCSNGLQDAPLHLSRFTPMYRLTQLPPTPVSTLESAALIARQAGMHYVYIGNVPGHNAESTVCHSCGELLIERRGFTIVKNVVRAGACPRCGSRIPGVWS